jgi:hypothetical protein
MGLDASSARFVLTLERHRDFFLKPLKRDESKSIGRRLRKKPKPAGRYRFGL